MDTYAHHERGFGYLRFTQQPVEDAWPRICATSTTMPAGQPSAADTEIRLSLLLCPARPVPVSGSQGGDGETVLQPVRSALGRSRKHAHLPLGRSILPVA